MSVDYTIYFGPVLICKNRYVDVSEDVKVCPKCEEESDANFCPKCGSKIVDIKKKTKDTAVCYWDITEQIKQRLINVSHCMGIDKEDALTDLYVPNQKHKSMPALHFDVNDEINYSLKGIDFNNSTIAFYAEYEKELAVMKKAYGVENITIDFRLMNWAS